jgi:hypothetical protein
MTRQAGPAPGRAAGGRACWQADLGAIRRSEELIDSLAARRVPAGALGDPAVSLLSSLTADVDAPARPAAGCPAAMRAGPRHRAGRPGRGGATRAWPHVAAAAAMAAAIASLTAVAAAGLVIVGMFARLNAARGRGRHPRY